MNFEVQPTFFATSLDFRAWLKKNHDKSTELIVLINDSEAGRKIKRLNY